MSVLLLPPIFQFFDNNGDPLANGFVYTYAAGTTTALATYTDSTGTVTAPNPIELNAAGRPTSGSGAIWGEGAYKFIVKDSNGVQVGDTLDNVTSFTGLAASTNAYAETFSGTGSQTVFTTSTDLGTDPKAIMVSVATGLQEIAQNGNFTTDTLWTKGAGWTIGAGVATATGAISTAISQVPVLTVVAGQAYAVTYTITRSAGGLIPSIGGQNGTERTASGTYREIIIAAASTPIAFTGNAFTGTLDSVSVTVATSGTMALLPTNAYTISGTALTFASAPALGVNNIDVRSPSSLVGAASTAATLAQGYAAAALVSETNAAASALLAATSVKWKPAVACATTANITLSGEQTIDTVLTSASRVLVKDQTNATQNGVYVSAAGAWTRATDADTWDEITSQAVFTSGGSANINKSWVNTNESGGTIGVTNITWTQLQAFGDMSKNVYDPANIAQQLVGTTATQTLSGKTLTGMIASAGTTSVAAAVFTSGANLTTAAAGSWEYDGKTAYFTPLSTQRGIVESAQMIVLNSAVVGANGTSAQSIFGKVVSLSASTYYVFEGNFNFSKSAGASAHTVSILFGGTATLNNIGYQAIAGNSATSFNAGFGTIFMNAPQVATATVTTVSISSANSFVTYQVKGIVSVNGAGTFDPQYILSAAPGGAYSTAVSSYFKIAPLGASGANISVGTWA